MSIIIIVIRPYCYYAAIRPTRGLQKVPNAHHVLRKGTQSTVGP